MEYKHVSFPWAFQWLVSQTPSKPNDINDLSLPIYIDKDGNVFRGISGIFVFLFSKSFQGKVRLYTPVDSLDVQESLEKWGPALDHLFLKATFESQGLLESYSSQQRESMSLPWGVLDEFFGFISQFVTARQYKVKDNATSLRAIKVVESGLDAFQRLVEKSKGRYLFGNTITAADLTFLAHYESLVVALQSHSLSKELEPIKNHSALKYGQSLLADQSGILSKQIEWTAINEAKVPYILTRVYILQSRAINMFFSFCAIAIFPCVLPFEWTVCVWIVIAFVLSKLFPPLHPQLKVKFQYAANLIYSQGGLKRVIDF